MSVTAPLVPVHVRDVWADIKDSLAEILTGCDERPEDVYAAAVYGDAHVYKNHEGYVVLRRVRNQYRRHHELVVWLAQAFVFGVNREFYQHELMRLARESGCRRVVFHTHRNGWERVLKNDWAKARVTYELEVPHE